MSNLKTKEQVKVTPKKEEIMKEENEMPNIEQEIAILQNEGIYRRELLKYLNEIINVLKQLDLTLKGVTNAK